MDGVAEKSYFLQPGFIFVSRDPYRIQTVLGSCVAVCLWDEALLFGGMNHFIHARPWAGQRNAQFGLFSVPHLLRVMIDKGARRSNLVAHVAGGAESPGLASGIGRDNAALALELLRQWTIPVGCVDVGGSRGRKVVVSNRTGELSLSVIESARGVRR